MVTSSELKESNNNSKNSFYRLFFIGKKYLPEIRNSESRAAERFWAMVGGVFEGKKEITKELFSDEFRKGDGAGPTGIGKYFIVRHQNHAEIAHILERPEELVEAQRIVA